MREEWRDIQGYEGKYMVSNLGRVKSLNYHRTGKERILKAYDNGYGYLYVNLSKEGKTKKYKIHRLVAKAFLENPEGYTEVNHINEDKADCRADNLEWCSRAYNNTYNGRAKKVGKKLAEKLSKPVFGINKVNGLILEFPSIAEASRQTGINKGNICSCLKGNYKSAGGYVWYQA